MRYVYLYNLSLIYTFIKSELITKERSKILTAKKSLRISSNTSRTSMTFLSDIYETFHLVLMITYKLGIIIISWRNTIIIINSKKSRMLHGLR